MAFSHQNAFSIDFFFQVIEVKELRMFDETLLDTIPILRQQNDWVGGVEKWPFLQTFSTVFMLIRWVGFKKAKNILT